MQSARLEKPGVGGRGRLEWLQWDEQEGRREHEVAEEVLARWPGTKETSAGHMNFIWDAIGRPSKSSEINQETVVIFQVRAGCGLETSLKG